MIQRTYHQTLARILSLGGAGVTAFLLTGSVTDPVNAPKLFLLGGVAGATLALLGYSVTQKIYRVTGLEIFIIAFLGWSILSLWASSSPISQGIYGVYGRNTGFLAYACLSLVAIAGTQLASLRGIEIVLRGFLMALAINLIYGLWVLVFGDFLGWQNNYGALLGTFGNPNFISSFLGMGFSLVLALSIYAQSRIRVSLLLALPLIAWQLFEADSLQGIVVAALGSGVVLYFLLRDKAKSVIWPSLYLALGAVTAGIAVTGALGIGPLNRLLSQPTVVLREQYWLAAINMAKSHPIFGVGLDSYGDWYRRSRSAEALITPGPNTVTNTAHNVYLDLLASGGYPLLLFYVFITAMGAYSIIWTSFKIKEYNPVFVGIVVLWVGYQAQSIISINQLGLAVWGWLINGLAIAFKMNLVLNEREKFNSKMESKNRKNINRDVFSPQLLSAIGAVIGLLLAVPPLSADAKWRQVQLSRQVNKVEPALQGSYMSPISSFRLAEAVQLLENSKLHELAIEYARYGVEFNPDFFEAWRFLYYATNSTFEEKLKAKNEMVRLDPLNPEWMKLN
jgi:O-antigen ligase